MNRHTIPIPGCPGIDVQEMLGTAGSRAYMLRVVGTDALLGDFGWDDLGQAVAAGAQVWTQLSPAQQTSILSPDWQELQSLRAVLTQLLLHVIPAPTTVLNLRITAGQEAG